MTPEATRTLLKVLFLFTLLATSGPASSSEAAEPANPDSAGLANDGQASATLPLEEILRLYRENEAAGETTPESPPIPASVSRIELSGRLLADAIDLTAQIELDVLEDGAWVAIPLLKRDAQTHISRLPTLSNGTLVSDQGRLTFVTRRAGHYTLEIGMLKQAEVDHARRKVTLHLEDATLSRLALRFDEALFRLNNKGAFADTDAYILYPEDGALTIEWERLRSSKPAAAQPEAARPPIESVISSAHASVVATLEGREVMRVLYLLQLEGTRGIEFELPEGFEVHKVLLNRTAVAFSTASGALTMDVAPGRTGDQSAELELVLIHESDGFLLSGTLEYKLPAASWHVNEYHAELSLPVVFNYQWAGGSLAPVEGVPAVSFSHSIPLPGKSLTFHQYLVSSAPDVSIRYTVDLADQYFQQEDASGFYFSGYVGR